METKVRDWKLEATRGIVGCDIDYDFFDDLSQKELLNFGKHLKEVVSMYDNEIKSRGR